MQAMFHVELLTLVVRITVHLLDCVISVTLCPVHNYFVLRLNYSR